MENDNWWRVVYGITVILELIVIIVVGFYYHNPSIFDLINLISNNPEKMDEIEPILEKEFSKIYTITDCE